MLLIIQLLVHGKCSVAGFGCVLLFAVWWHSLLQLLTLKPTLRCTVYYDRCSGLQASAKVS